MESFVQQHQNHRPLRLPNSSSTPLCDCAAALEKYTPYVTYRTKIDSFIRHWDLCLHIRRDGAYDYDGTQQSHHVFFNKGGLTPKHYAREFFQNASQLFAPAGKLQDLVKAMVDFWVMRTALWKVRYSNQEEAKKKWDEETYDTSDRKELSHRGVDDLVGTTTGKYMMIHDLNFGPDNHQSTAYLVPLTKLKKGFAVKVATEKLCHQDCPIAYAAADYHLKNYVAQLAQTSEFGKVDVKNVRYGPSAEMRAVYGLAPDDTAPTTGRDVLYVV